MRRHAGWVLFAVLLFAACGSDGSSKASTTSTEPVPSTVASTSAVPVASTVPLTTVASTTVPAPTTTQGCPASGSTAPFATPPASTSANLLTAVRIAGRRCADAVTFAFRPDKGAPPLCTVAYQSGPFTTAGSGAPVTVAGTAFLFVRCEPARTIDLVTNETTYTPPANRHTVPVGTKHVVDLVETGDFEGVITWVIGLDAQQPFLANAGAGGALVVSVA
jgi:hypothetical protein